jgi:spore maturation protein CgeB
MVDNFKLLLYGEEPLKGSGIWCYLQALQSLGVTHKSISCELGLKKYQNNYFFKAVRKLNGGRLLANDRLKHARLVADVISSYLPDLLVVSKGLYLDDDFIIRIKEYGIKVFIFNHDDFFSLNKNNVSIYQNRAIPHYDHVFVTRLINVEEVKKLNQNVSFFPFSFLPSFHKIYDISDLDISKYQSDVLFVGTYERDRARLLESLVDNFKLNLAVYGPGWHRLARTSNLRNYIAGKGLWGEEMAKAIQLSKVCIGFLRKENRDQYTQRTFEILACGGVLLAEKTDFHLTLFEGKEICLLFDPTDPKHFSMQLLLLLKDEKLREKIRCNGIQWIQNSNYTYESRVRQLIEKFNEIRNI